MPFIVFDLDGTLVDSVPDIAVAVDRTFGERGLPPLGAARIRTLVGEGARSLVERALAAHGRLAPAAEVDACLVRFRSHYGDRLCVDSRLYPGIIRLLEGLGDCPKAVLTNKPGDLARRLVRALGIERHFLRVVGDDDGLPRKPDPTALLALMAEAGHGPRATLLVGDGRPDVDLAVAAGVAIAAVTWGYGARAQIAAAGPQWLVDNTSDLKDIIGSWAVPPGPRGGGGRPG